MRVLLVTLALLLLPACDSIEGNIRRVKDHSDQIVFFQHHQSGLCFAYMWEGGTYGGPGLAAIPCEKVEKLLVNPLLPAERTCVSECYRNQVMEVK